MNLFRYTVMMSVVALSGLLAHAGLSKAQTPNAQAPNAQAATVNLRIVHAALNKPVISYSFRVGNGGETQYSLRYFEERVHSVPAGSKVIISYTDGKGNIHEMSNDNVTDSTQLTFIVDDLGYIVLSDGDDW